MKQIVKVKFISKTAEGYDLYNKEYWYIFKTKEENLKLKAGDFAIIESVQDRSQDPFSVVKIIEAEEYSYDRINEIIDSIQVDVKTKELIGKADLGSYFAEKERQEKIRQINANLANRFKEAEKLALYKQLAETDPIMKDLLAQLEALGGSLDVEDLATQSELY